VKFTILEVETLTKSNGNRGLISRQ
jgi:hypothetical protein